MNILMLTPRFPYPPNRGDTLRSWHELEYLASRHDVWLASLDEKSPEPGHLQKVQSICREVAVFTRPSWRSLLAGGASLLLGKSLVEGYFNDPRLQETLRVWSLTTRFDAQLTFTVAMSDSASVVDAPRRVLDMCDLDSAKLETFARRAHSPMRLIYSLESIRLRKAELRLAASHDSVLMVNRRERDKMLALTTPQANDVVHTCVAMADSTTSPPASEPVVGCVGSMFYPPNIRAVNWFGRHVWPLIKQARPDSRWLIVGARPARSVKRWGRLPDVEVTGFVPEVKPYLDSMRVFINPVDGDIGVQSKLLGAMAAGKPAVVTPDAAAGIDYDAPTPFLVARSPRDYAEAVLDLLSNDAEAERLGRTARRVIEQNYLPDTQLWRVERALIGDRAAGFSQGVSDAKRAVVQEASVPA